MEPSALMKTKRRRMRTRKKMKRVRIADCLSLQYVYPYFLSGYLLFLKYFFNFFQQMKTIKASLTTTAASIMCFNAVRAE